MRSTLAFRLVPIGASLALIGLSAQAPVSLTVKIVAPVEDTYVSGQTQLRAQIDPADGAATVVFYADGRQVCALTKAPYECPWDAGPNIIEHQIRVVVTAKAGGRTVSTVVTKGIGFAESVEVDLVEVTATVMDGSKYVNGLPQSAFHIAEDGIPQKVTHFTSENVPLVLVVALDVSSSMAPSMTQLKAAAKEFLGSLGPRDQVTLLGFNDSIFTLIRKTANAAQQVAAVDRLAPWGATALYDVIVHSIDLLGRQTGRKALIVFSDGEDEGSHATLDEAERRIQASDVTLYAIAQGRGVKMDRLKKTMERLAKSSGGRALFMEKIAELKGAFTELLEELSHQYLLGYEPTNAKRDGTLRQLKIEVDGQRHVRARQAYRAPAK